ncbi:MAG: hypothetical protein DYH15_03440 [Nitrosomonas sp. PRO4]|nr:hypothetical protein [Nitrosomonas sp. PRO4]
MSRLWRDQYQSYLAPERLDLVRYARGFKPVQTAKKTVFCKIIQGTPSWKSALQILDNNLADAAGTELSVTLSNHFVRYVTLPPQTEIATPEEVKSYATFRIREIYADRIDAWQLSVSEWSPGNGAICAAIPRILMTQLEEIAARHQCKLKAVEPYLASAYDHWQQLLSGDRVYFAVIETGRICIAILGGGIWLSIRNQKILDNPAQELLVALDQEAIFLNIKQAADIVYVFSPEHPQLKLPENCGWRIIPLPTELMPALAHYPSVTANPSEMNQCLA